MKAPRQFTRFTQSIDRTLQAVSNALEFLESLGYRGGDIHDELLFAKRSLEQQKRLRDQVIAKDRLAGGQK